MTKSGRVWRKVPESGARSVVQSPSSPTSWDPGPRHCLSLRLVTETADLSARARPILRTSLSGTFLQTVRFSYATEGALFISAQLSSDAVSALRKVRVLIKLQALVYDILPSTTAVFSYAIGSRKLSANEQFFVGAHTVVICYKQLRLYQTFVLN